MLLNEEIRMAPETLDSREAVASLKRLVIECELPKTDMALFGVLCPFCGKTDRIRQLERPPALRDILPKADLELYKTAWDILVSSEGDLGFCKFCLNPLRLDMTRGFAEPACD
jgi:hypothetical protein